MKKILLAVAIVCAAVFSQAAVVKWSVVNVQSSPSTTIAGGWVVAVYVGNAADFSYADAANGSLVAAETQYTVANAAGTMYNVSTPDGFGDYDAGTPLTIYAVIYDAATIADAKYYIVSADVDASIGDTGGDKQLTFGNMGVANASANKFYGTEWQPVPEPTSGLLLLLGMGALALRRKRA